MMFVFSVKATRKRVSMLLVGAVAAVAMIVLALALPPAQATGATPTDRKVISAEERAALLAELGYTVTDETVREVRVPEESDTALDEYEALQAASGLGLKKYGGKRVKLYTYTVSGSEPPVTVHLYVYRDRVVAGDVTAADGTQTALITKGT